MHALDQDVLLLLVGRSAGPAPTTKFVRSVRRQGVIVPVILREMVQDDGHIIYGIIDGNRRVAAARQAGNEYIPARVLIGVTVEDAARLTLATNSFRSGNLVTELWAIRQLERSGVTRQGIVGASGLTSTNFRVCDRLSGLDRRVFVGFAEGKISTSAALTVARMREQEQRQVGDLYEAQGKLPVKDLRAFGKGRQERGKSGRNVVHTIPDVAPPPVRVVERYTAPVRYSPSVDPGLENQSTVAVAPVPGPPRFEQDADIVPASHIDDNLQHAESDGERLSTIEADVPLSEGLPAERSTGHATWREPVTLVRHDPSRPAAPTPVDPSRAIPDDLRIAVRSIALRAIQLDIPERRLTRMIQEVYQEKGATQDRDQQPDVGERYA